MNIKTAFLPFIRSDTFLIFKNRQHIMSLTINTPFTSLGKTLPKVAMAAATTQVTPAPGQEDGDRDQELNPSSENQDFNQNRRKEDGSKADSVKDGGVISLNRDPSATVGRTKPLVSRKNGTKPKLPERPASRKPNVPYFLRFNASKAVPGGRKVGPGTQEGERRKLPVIVKRPKPLGPTVRDRIQEETALTARDPSVEASSTERSEDKNSAIMSGTNSGTNSKESTVAPGTQKQPDVGTEVQRGDADPVSSEPTGAGQSHEKKCMNKIKVTHIRLPLKDRSSGCRGDGTVLEGKTTSDPHQGSSETDDTPLENHFDLTPLSPETDPNHSPDPLHKLLTDTFDSLNITTFSVHLSKPADISDDAAAVRKQILGGLRPLSSSSLSQSTSSTSQSSSLPSSSSSSSSSAESTSLTSSLTSTAAPSLTYLILSSASLLPSPPSSLPSLSSSSLERSDPGESNEADIATDSTPSLASPEDRKVPPREGGIPFFRRTRQKGGYIRRPFQNRTRLYLKAPFRSGSPPEVNVPVSDTSAEKDEATTLISSGAEQNHKKTPTKGGTLLVHRLPPNGGYLRRPFSNAGPSKNQTRRTRPTQPLNHAMESGTEPISSNESPAPTSPPSSTKEKSYPIEGTRSGVEDTEGNVGGHLPTKFNQTRANGVPSSDHPTSRGTPSRRPNLYVGPFQNRNRTNLRPTQPPHRGPMRKPLPKIKLNGNGGIRVGQTIQSAKENIGGRQRVGDPKAKHEFDTKTEQTRSGSSESPKESDVSSSGVKREPLDYVGVTNQTSDGFTVIWDAPEGKYKNFVVTKKESGRDEEPQKEESRKELEEEDSEKETENRNTENENRVLESVGTQIPTIQSIKEVKPATESDKIVLPGSARSFQFEDLPPQKEYTVTLLGKGPGLLSRLHKLVISTGTSYCDSRTT